METIAQRIEAFKKQIKKDPTFCKQLYREATIRLMALKYAYYVESVELVKDYSYDLSEQSWFVMGRALGVLNEDETSPCIDFDSRHPFAKEGKKLALKLIGGKRG